MSTTLAEIEDSDYETVLEIYDSISYPKGCKLFIHKKGEEKGLKFHVNGETAEKIVDILTMIRFA